MFDIGKMDEANMLPNGYGRFTRPVPHEKGRFNQLG
jgi:hypothetical protein